MGDLGVAYKRMGNEAKARANLNRAVKLLEADVKVNPKNATALGLLANYKAELGDKQAGTPLVERFLAAGLENKENLISAAEIYATMGDGLRAIDLARRAMALGYSEKRLRRSVELRALAGQILTKP